MPQFSSIIGVGIPGATGPAGPPGATGPQGPPGPGADLSDTAAAALGVAAAGTSAEASRADHVHPMPNAAAVGAMAAVAGNNGGVMGHASGAWASTAAGTARQVLTSAGTGAPTWGQDVLPLRIGATVAAALPSDAALGLQWSVRSIVVRGSGNAAWMDVWRVSDPAGEWVYGTSDATDCAGAVLLAPSSGAGLYLRRGSTDHVRVSSAGALTVGTTSHTTALQGTNVTLAGTSGLQIGYTSVVAVYVGGARVPRVTISSSTTLDASHEVVHVDATSGAVTITLPPPSEGRLITIQRKRGANNVVVQRNAAETIRTGGANVNSTTIADDSRHSFIYDADSGEWSMEA